MNLVSPIEKLRRIWTPEKEVYELADKLEPSTELDSLIRDFLCRIMEQRLHSVTLDMSVSNTGNVRWEIVTHEQSGKQQVTIWWEQ